MKKLLLTMLVLYSIPVLSQQLSIPMSVRGRVTHPDKEIPFENIKMMLYHNAVFVDSVRTDSAGYYRFDLKHHGNYLLIAYQRGFLNDTVAYFDPSEYTYEDNVCEIWFMRDVSMDSLFMKRDTDFFTKKISTIHAYPNPTTGIVTIENIPDYTEFTVLDMSGRIMQSFQSGTEKQLTLNLAEFQSGMYLVKYVENGILKVKRLIRQ